MHLRHALGAAHRPSFYMPGDPPARGVRVPAAPFDTRMPLCKACAYMLVLTLALSLPSSLLAVAKLLPTTLKRWDPETLVRIFPAGLELVFNESTLQVRPLAPEPDGPMDGRRLREEASAQDGERSSFICWTEDAVSWCADAERLEPIRLELPTMLWDFLYTELPRYGAATRTLTLTWQRVPRTM